MIKIITFLFMFPLIQISAQSAFSLNGLNGLTGESFSSLNAFEFNQANYSVIKDWGFSFTYGGEIEPEFSSNLYQVTAAKNIGKHFLTLRYSPGFQKEFILKSNPVKEDSTNEPTNLEKRYTFKELFGIGYSYKITDQFTAGMTLRYFDQSFTDQNLTIVYTTSEPYFEQITEVDKSNFWKLDFGLVWKPSKIISMSISSNNLMLIKSEFQNKGNNDFEFRTKKTAIGGLNIFPADNINLNILYETDKSFVASSSLLFNVSTNKIGIALSAFHDNLQNPFISAITPSAIFISKYFDISVSWINYLENRSSTGNYDEFFSDGISNIINNKYSFDKILLTTNFKLNTLVEQRVKFLDVTLNQSLYPALAEKYIDNPIATGKVVNLTNERIEVKPLVMINGINQAVIYSPVTTIFPYDTIDISFYTMIPEDYSHANPELTYADFYLMTVNDDYDDQFQKALLVNGINAWDGNVFNLKYFIKKDLDFSVKFTKSALTQNKALIDTIPNALSDFYKAKIIFNAFIKNLTYISDPRATAEYVQYPKQTIELKGGDCDDLSVCFSSLLESAGIESALVDFKNDKNLRHVNVMFNTKLNPQQSFLITNNETKYFIRKNQNGTDEIWLPIETTTLTDFSSAWLDGSEKFLQEAINNFGLINGEVEIIDLN